jgi:eukaryotic-like serine/threonine-protein kinase
VFKVAVDGPGEIVRVTSHPTAPQFPREWAADGRILFQVLSGTAMERGMWSVSADGGTPEPLFRNSQQERNGRLSADGRWLAYESDASGRTEIYVRAFSGAPTSWRVSLDGGTWPVWSRDGRELFFRHDDSVMAAAVTASPEFRSATPRQLFREPALESGFDVAPDGRFLAIKQHPQPPTELILVQNWFDELKARVPTK